MSQRIDDLKLLIERNQKCRAKHVVSTPVHEQFEGMPVWDGVVETFQLEDHLEAKRAYAWVIPTPNQGEDPYVIVLGVAPVNSAQDAVRASVPKAHKDLIRLARKIKFGK